MGDPVSDLEAPLPVCASPGGDVFDRRPAALELLKEEANTAERRILILDDVLLH